MRAPNELGPGVAAPEPQDQASIDAAKFSAAAAHCEDVPTLTDAAAAAAIAAVFAKATSADAPDQRQRPPNGHDHAEVPPEAAEAPSAGSRCGSGRSPVHWASIIRCG